MAHHRITRAYCVELQEVVTITQARKEFLAMEPRLEKFHFLCSDQQCRDVGVEVTGVLYRENAQESVKHKAAHFREKDKHLPSCEWEVPSEEEDEKGLLQGETEDAARRRRARRKLNDFIDVFDPYSDDISIQVTAPVGFSPLASGSSDGAINTGDRHGGKDDSDFPGVTRTNDLERLVECYREAKETLPPDEFSELEIVVKGLGRIKLCNYFKRLSYARSSTVQHVVYGGVKTAIKRYGKGESYTQGFLLKFFDQIEGKPVSLYVSPAMMQEYRYRKYIDGILKKADQVRYFTIYAMGHFEPAPNEYHGLNLIITKLRQLAIVLGPEKEIGSPGHESPNDIRTIAAK
jgi:hypothetical protein